MTPLDDDHSDHNQPAGPTDVVVVNDVHLVGHMSKRLEIKEMPSGDWLGKWALVVKRPRRDDPGEAGEEQSSSNSSAAGAANRRRQSYDTIDCVSFDMDLIERLNDLLPRTRLEVRGALRRRFRRDQPGQSRYEVEAFAVAVLSTPTQVEKADDAADLAGVAETVTAAG